MSKSSKRSSKRSRRQVKDRSATTDIMTQLECAAKNPHAAAIGAIIGGLVPWFGRTLAHEEAPAVWSTGNHTLASLMIAVVLGCALFSALTVYKFGTAAFGDPRKALGFVLALEGVMLVSHGTTSTVALIVLIAINAVANGSVIALARDATRRRAEADARRVATRVRGRAAFCAPSVVSPEAENIAPPAWQTAQVRPPAVPTSWRRASLNEDAVDAVIVSESRLLA